MAGKRWWQTHWGAIAILGVIGFFVVALILTSSKSLIASSTSGVSPDLQDLNATVETTQDGIYVTNDESSDWTNCMVGLNSQDNLDAYNPPYQTQDTLAFAAGDRKLVPYQQITTGDGTFFDITTHAVNSVVIVCNVGTAQARYWRGTNSNG